MKQTLSSTAQRLYKAGHDLIPLKPMGKKPLQAKWTTLPRTLKAELQAAIKRGCNLGLRLKPEDLIIDVDVKNNSKGLTSWDSLCNDFPELAPLEPCTDTPSGGFHVWLSKPPGKIHKTHATYPGIDFLGSGAQVLIGGCETDVGTYIDHAQEIFPAAPDDFLLLLNRAPISSAKITKPGAWDDIRLAEALKTLDVTSYRTDDEWLRIGMACHHATNGDGKEAFLNWSAGDPMYGLPRKPQNELRWDSFDADSPGGVTGAFLVGQLRDAGELDLAEQLNLALADAGGMFEVVTDPVAEHHAKAVELIQKWDEPHNMQNLYKSICRGDYDKSSMDQFEKMIRGRFPIRAQSIRAGFLKAAAQIRSESGGNVAGGEEVEFIQRLIEARGGSDSLVNSEGRLWVWRQDLGYYKEALGDAIGGIVMAYADEASEVMAPGAVSRLQLLLRAQTASVDREDFWDAAAEGVINTRLGEVTLGDDGWELRPHRKESRLRNITRFEFGHEGKPRLWMKWLKEAFSPDTYSVMTRRVAVGMVYTLLSSKPFLKKAWLLYGPPNTGKSMLIKVLGRVLGGNNYSSTALSKMTGPHGIAPLVGKMANMQSEIEIAEKVDAAIFKAIVSGDFTEANPKNMQQFMFQNRAVLWMAGNNLPKFAQDTTSGVIDRLVPVAFQNAVAEIDRGLTDKLHKESDRIVNWALWIYNEEAMFDFPCLELSGDSEIEAELKSEMETDETKFVGECLIVTKNLEDFVATEDLTDRYNRWINFSVVSKTKFRHILAKQLLYIPGLREGRDYKFGVSSSRPQRRGVFGVKMKDPGNE